MRQQLEQSVRLAIENGQSPSVADGLSDLGSAGAPCTRPPHAGNLASLLHIAVREQLEHARPTGIAITSDGLHNVTCVGNDAVLVQPIAHEVNDAPMIIAERYAFSFSQTDGDVLRPVFRIDEVAFGIRRNIKFVGHPYFSPYVYTSREVN